LKTARLLKRLAEQVGKPLADRGSKEVGTVRLTYASIRDGGKPFPELKRLASVLNPGPESDALLELIAAATPRKTARRTRVQFQPENFKPFVPPAPPSILCVVCKSPVYFYEKQDPPTCLWCEKMQDAESTSGM